MNDHPYTPPTGGLPAADHSSHSGHAGHAGHGWMMIACCIPMIVIAVALVASGVARPSVLFAAFACTAMMALMMRGMDHGSGANSDATDGSSHAGHGR